MTTGVVRLCELQPEQSSDCFAMLSEKDRSKTRDGKPYYRVTFRDAVRSATAMIWSDSAWFADCRQNWQVGCFYKLRCRYSETQYGPQVELDRVREVIDSDRDDGFDPSEFFGSTRFDTEQMFSELVGIAETKIDEIPLRQLVTDLLHQHADPIKQMPAAARNHHAYRGGYLEHVLSVTQTAVFLADKYDDYYPQMRPPLSKSLVVAGAILHDIGKIVELDDRPQGAVYTAPGRLIGHILLGRDLIREAARAITELDPETALRLEHIIVAHQNLPEWGSPISPHTPEALLVYFADDIDAKFNMMAHALEDESTEEDATFTSRQNPLRRALFRGLNRDDSRG